MWSLFNDRLPYLCPTIVSGLATPLDVSDSESNTVYVHYVQISLNYSPAKIRTLIILKHINHNEEEVYVTLSYLLYTTRAPAEISK